MIVIVGKTCSGKSTVAKILEEKYKYRRIITYTTRPPRKNEITGDEYYFTATSEFKRLKNIDYFFETTSYNVANGETWYYGTPKDKFRENSVIVMNPDGMKKVKKLIDANDLNIRVFYLNTKEAVLWNRLRSRSSENADEVRRRLDADNEDFNDIDQYYDYSISTDTIDAATMKPVIPDAIADWIHNIMIWESNRKS